MLIPRLPLVWMFSVPLVQSFLSLADETLGPFVWWSNAAILLLALVDAAFGYRTQASLQAASADVFSLGRRNKVTVAIRSNARRKLQFQLNGDGFEHAERLGVPCAASLEPGGEVTLAYQLVPRRRGAYNLGDHYLRIRTPIGLWDWQVRFDSSQSVRVYPDLHALRTFGLLARQARENSLLRATKLKGGESEFSRLREYTRDDEYRAIDWKATARRQRLTAREYQLESNQSAFFMLDAGRLMTEETGKATLLDHALNATLMLSQVALRNGDRVGLLGFDDAIRAFVPPAAGPAAGRRLIQATYNLHASLVEADYEHALDQFSVRVRKRSLLILFAQVVDESVSETLLRRIQALTPLHLPLLVLLRNSELDALMHRPSQDDEDLYTRAAAAELLRFRHLFLQDLRSRGALVLDADPRELSASLINQYLQVKARQLL